MGLGDRAADRQSHANPIGPGRVERFEEPVEFSESSAGPMSCTSTAMRFAPSMPETIVSSRRPVAGTSHRLYGVDDQVNRYLLQLDPICRNQRQVVRKPRLPPEAIALHLA